MQAELRGAVVGLVAGAVLVPAVTIAGAMRVPVPPASGEVRPYPPPHVDTAKIQLIVVRASREGEPDPRLRGMEETMHERGWKGFQLASVRNEMISSASAEQFWLPGDYSLRVGILGRTSTHANLRLRVMKDGELHHTTEVTLPKNQGYITVVKPEDHRAAIVMAITPKF